jgi:hypothetical protein
MPAQSKLIVEIQEDGTLKTNAREVLGEEGDIIELLEAIAQATGGELVVEKHEPGVHHHHHGHGHSHTHGGHGHSH